MGNLLQGNINTDYKDITNISKKKKAKAKDKNKINLNSQDSN